MGKLERICAFIIHATFIYFYLHIFNVSGRQHLNHDAMRAGWQSNCHLLCTQRIEYRALPP